jgi:hypothetical protein
MEDLQLRQRLGPRLDSRQYRSRSCTSHHAGSLADICSTRPAQPPADALRIQFEVVAGAPP